MQITKDKVATFDFTVSDDQGQILDSSSKIGPFPYIHGNGYLVRGLESAMEGKAIGDSFSVTIPPAQGYGERDESLLTSVPKNKFQGIEDMELGTLIQVGGPNGTQIMEVVEITENDVTLDGNHPLAGMTLKFDVSIVDVRDATAEELQAGHPMIEGCDYDCDCGCDEDHEHGGCGSGGCNCGC